MKKRVITLSTAALLSLCMGAAAADESRPSYSHIGISWIEFDLDGPDGSAVELSGGLGLAEYVYVQGKYLYGETDDVISGVDNAEVTQYEAGLGLRAPLGQEGDIFLEVGLVEAEVQVGPVTVKGDGEYYRLGLRGMLSSNVEMSANLLRQEDNSTGENGIEIGLLGYLNQNLALSANYQSIDESDYFKFGLRFDID